MRASRVIKFAAASAGTGRRVFLAGQGQVPVTRKQADVTLASMGGEAVRRALRDADVDPARVGALYASNMMSGMLSNQQHIGPLVADAAGGLEGVEAATAEACCGAGGAALRWGTMAVASGLVDVVVVAGVEQMTHASAPEVTKR